MMFDTNFGALGSVRWAAIAAALLVAGTVSAQAESISLEERARYMEQFQPSASSTVVRSEDGARNVVQSKTKGEEVTPAKTDGNQS